MPTYQYQCTQCGRDLEVQQSFSDASLTECPECAGRLRKVFNAVGVVFKGSGFYRNDSRAGAKDGGGTDSGDGKADTKSDAKSDSGADKKSDAKTDKKSETKPAAKDGSSSGGSKASTSA